MNKIVLIDPKTGERQSVNAEDVLMFSYHYAQPAEWFPREIERVQALCPFCERERRIVENK